MTAFVESCVQTTAGEAAKVDRRARGKPRAAKLLRLLADKKKILLTTHVHPDPDALASTLGLCHLLSSRLKDAHIEAEAAGLHAVRLKTPMSVDRIPGFDEGVVSVQDAGAQRAAQLLDVKDGMRVLDACAAPGGKTGHILELATVDLIALESDAERSGRIEQNLKRLKLEAQVEVGDAGDPAQWFDGAPFDRILADVPCSASGIVRRT